MNELYMMATISDRNQVRRFLAFYKEYGMPNGKMLRQDCKSR